MMKIASRWDAGKVLFEADGDTHETVVEAVAKRTYLRGAYLRGAYLRGADIGGARLGGAYLGGAYLGGARLRGADLGGADLGGADLRGAYLRGAYLGGARLRGADLGGADLGGADLRGADLGGADLRGAKVAWQSHDMLAEILRRAAGDDVEKRKIAGLVLISRDWCWERFAALSDPLLPWAMAELARWIQPADDHPVVLDAYAEAEPDSPAIATEGTAG